MPISYPATCPFGKGQVVDYAVNMIQLMDLLLRRVMELVLHPKMLVELEELWMQMETVYVMFHEEQLLR